MQSKLATEGMELTEDLYCPKNGKLLLLNKGTVLTQEIITRLVNRGVSYINTKHSDNKSERMQLDDRFMHKELIESPYFKEFEQQHNAYLKALKIELNSIINGSSLEPKMFSTVVSSLTKKALTKMNLLNYIRYIPQLDDTIFTHSLNVAILCSIAAGWYGLKAEEAHYLVLAGLFHDIGKIIVPKEILNKSGKLTKEEFEMVQRHTLHGYDILLSHKELPISTKLPALMHHEKADGKGYPRGIDNRQISKLSKIVSLCDIYEALTADRTYRKRLSPFYVLKEMESGRCGHLDAAITKQFLRFLTETFIGSSVKLNGAIVGKVVHINPQDPTSPLIQCESGFIDLSTIKNVEITSVF